MNKYLAISVIALAAACSQGEKEATAQPVENESAVEASVEQSPLQMMRDQFAVVEMAPDVSFLSDEERAVVNKLNQVGVLMSEIYLRQRSEENPAWRDAIVNGDAEDKDLLLNLFDLHFGPWDTLDGNKPFYGDTAMPDGAAFIRRI